MSGKIISFFQLALIFLNFISTSTRFKFQNEDLHDNNSPTKTDLLKNAKIKHLLPNAKKLKNAFQKPKSNESI